MALRIQRIPAGLLNFLGIVGSGRTLEELSQTVSPIVDVSGFYQQPDLDSIASANVQVAAEGDEARIVVPPGESWKLIALGAVMVALTPPEQAFFYCGYGIENGTGVPGLTVPFVFQQQPKVVAAPTETIRIGGTLPQVVILPPGGHIMAAIMQPIGGLPSIQVRALFHRLRQ